MPERLHPGVYVEEVKPAVLAIEGVSTSTAAFIGVAERGPVNHATLVTSFAEYQRLFGAFRPDSFLTYAVDNFFRNGGRKCYIVRVTGANAATADVVLNDRERVGMEGPLAQDILADILPAAFAEPVLTISASSPGRWGNLLDVDIQDGTRDETNEFKIVVKMEDEVVETWDNLSMSQGDENYVENLLGGEQSQYIQVKRIAAATSDTPGVLISGELDAAAQDLTGVTKTPVMSITLAVPLPGGGTDSRTIPKITLDKTGKDTGAEIATEMQAKVRASVPADASAEMQRASREFRCVFVPPASIGAPGRYVLISGSDANPSTVAVPAAAGVNAATEEDGRNRLKLNTEAEVPDKAFAIDGRALQRGTSRSANEPVTVTDGRHTLSFNLNRDGFQSVQLDAGLNGGDNVADNIQAKVRAIHTQRKDQANESAYTEFSAAYEARYELTFGAVSQNAGTFTFVASQHEPQDLSNRDRLRLRVVTAGSETTYGGSTTGPLPMRPGRTARERTIVSGSGRNGRPSANLSAITNGELRLRIDPPDPQVDPPAPTAPIDLDIILKGVGQGSGERIAKAIEDAMREKANDPVLANFPAIKEALTGFTARYVAYYTLTSGAVRTADAVGAPVGPVSSVEVLQGVNASVDVAPDLKLGLVNGGTEQNGSAMLRPALGEYHVGDNTVGGAVVSVTAGANGTAPADRDYVGDGVSTGLNALDKITDISLIAIPGIGSKQVVAAGFAYCVNRPLLDCFFIADLGGAPPADTAMFRSDVPFVTRPTDARDYVRALPTKNDYGAIYFPWLIAPDPIGKGKNPTRVLPPSGYVAGMYARIDNQRGVFKAPAGTETNLGNVLDLAAKIDDVQQDLLNPLGINVIRSFPASGTVIWGTRTLSSDSAWRYVPVRRLAIFLRVSIYNGIQYAVFEPNDEDLWASLRLTIGAFMLTQFRAGAFQGIDPKKAFFVKCDETTTIQADIDNGVVNILVGFAPLKPAEFVVLKLSQIAGQSPL